MRRGSGLEVSCKSSLAHGTAEPGLCQVHADQLVPCRGSLSPAIPGVVSKPHDDVTANLSIFTARPVGRGGQRPAALQQDFLCRFLSHLLQLLGLSRLKKGRVWPRSSVGLQRSLVAVHSPYSRSEPTCHSARPLALQRQITAHECSGQGSIFGLCGTASGLNSAETRYHKRSQLLDHQISRIADISRT